MTVVIEGDRITTLGRAGHVQVPVHARVVEAEGKYLIPGLWDMRVHLFGAGSHKADTYFPLLIANGVRGVRDMSTDPEDLKLVCEWQRELDAGERLGPRVMGSSTIVDGVPPRFPSSLARRDARGSAPGRASSRTCIGRPASDSAPCGRMKCRAF